MVWCEQFPWSHVVLEDLAMPKVVKLRSNENPHKSSSIRVATLTRRSTDEEHQPYSIEMQDKRLASYVYS
jgi:hypothetical protein